MVVILSNLTFDRLMKAEKLRKGCHTLTGWKTPELFKSFWEWVKNVGVTVALLHESKGPSPQRAARGDLRVIGMDDAFFMFWLITKQGISSSAAGYLFGIEPACVTRSFISITSILQEFIERVFDCTEVSAQGCSSGTAHAAMYSSYKGRQHHFSPESRQMG